MRSTTYKIVIALFFLPIQTLYAQVPSNPNKLQLCPTDYWVRYHKCWGTNKDSTYTYVGEFQNNTFNGFGTETSPWGYYVGYFNNSEREGQGILTKDNGLVEIGEFKRGFLHGRGIKYSSDGTIREQGIYEKGALITVENIAMNFMNQIFNSILPSDRGSQNTGVRVEVKKIPNTTTTFDVAKSKCEELGFKPQTEGFGKCVLQLSK